MIGSFASNNIGGENELKRKDKYRLSGTWRCLVIFALTALSLSIICSSFFFFPILCTSSQDVGWEQSFDLIDKRHEGRLNISQLYSINKELGDHFNEIDYNDKEFVTKNDIRAWLAERDHDEQESSQLEPLSPRSAFYGHHANETQL